MIYYHFTKIWVNFGMYIIDLDNQSTLAIDLGTLEKIAKTLTKQSIELIVTDNAHIANLNAAHRGKSEPTDVLSFPMQRAFEGVVLEGMPLGSIVISEAFVREKAAAFGHSEEAELTLLFIHGLLHLLGYDHEVDEGEMRAKEREIIEAFALPSSLIIRTEEL
jgi:probable rRNA maturation factor